MNMRVVGQHVPRGDVARDPLGPARRLVEIAGRDEERRLLHACALEAVDQARGPLVLAQECARAARYVVESERDALRPGLVCCGSGAGGKAGRREQGENRAQDHAIVGITKAFDPSPPPSGQRWVTVLVLVQKRTPSMPCWLWSPKAERFQPPNEW